MIYSAKVCRVINPCLVEVAINLGLGVTIRKRVWMRDAPNVSDDSIRKKAIHCLVVLIGGKHIKIDIPDTDSGRIEGVILRELDRDKIDAFTGLINESNMINVNAVMRTLQGSDFDVNNVKSRLIEGRTPNA